MSGTSSVRIDIEYDGRFERQIEAGKVFADTGIRLRAGDALDLYVLYAPEATSAVAYSAPDCKTFSRFENS